MPNKGSYEAVFGHLGMTPDEIGNRMFVMSDLLLRAADAIEVLDGTSVENEQLVDDYRAWRLGTATASPAGLRDEFAGRALQGMLSSPPIVDRAGVARLVWANHAYAWADAMLAARGGC